MTPHEAIRRRLAERIPVGQRMSFIGYYEPERGTESWFVQVPEVYTAGKAPSFDEIEPTIRRLVSQLLDVDGDAFDVRLVRSGVGG